MKNGKLIVFEGVDGTGKTTQLERLAAYLRPKFPHLLCLKEPGGTPLGEQVREILLSHDPELYELDPMTELLLFSAARRELCVKVIGPSLSEGKLILLDRFIYSSVAYQGYGRGVALEYVHQVNDAITGGIKPDLVILLDMEPAAAFQRLSFNDRIEVGGADFFNRVRSGYLNQAETEPNLIKVVNAARTEDEVFQDILDLTLRIRNL